MRDLDLELYLHQTGMEKELILYNHNNKEETDNEFLSYYIKNNGCIILAILDDEVVGMVIVADCEYKNTSYITSIIVNKEYRNFKIGSLLLDETKKYIKNVKKHSYVMLHVHTENKIAINMYKKQGFSPISMVMKKRL